MDTCIIYGVNSRSGMSGSPVIMRRRLADGSFGPAFIYGVHVGGAPSLAGYACPVTRGEVADLWKALECGPKGEVKLDAGPMSQFDVVPISDRSFLNNLYAPRCIPIGTLRQFHASTMKNQVVPTLVSPYVDLQNEWTSPTLTGRVVEGKWIDPVVENLTPIFELSDVFDVDCAALRRSY